MYNSINIFSLKDLKSDSPKKHYYWIDLLRFTAALLVVMAHYRGMFFIQFGLLPASQKGLISILFYFFTRLGEEPVIIFFVLSGFLVGGRALERILTNTVDLQSYAVDRAVRILLPLIASSIFVILIYLLIGKSISYIDILGSIFSLQGIITNSAPNAPLWSLSYEVWFYVLMGALMVIFRGKNSTSRVFSLFLFSGCIFLFAQLNFTYLIVLFIGVLTFFMPRFKKINARIGLYTSAFLLLGTSILSTLMSDSRSFSLPDIPFLSKGLTTLLVAVSAGLLIHFLVNAKPRNRIQRDLDKIGTASAKFSYTLYLTHYPLMYLLSYLGLPKSSDLNIISISLYLFEILISLGIAYLIFLLSEKHTYATKNFLKKRLNKVHFSSITNKAPLVEH